MTTISEARANITEQRNQIEQQRQQVQDKQKQLEEANKKLEKQRQSLSAQRVIRNMDRTGQVKRNIAIGKIEGARKQVKGGIQQVQDYNLQLNEAEQNINLADKQVSAYETLQSSIQSTYETQKEKGIAGATSASDLNRVKQAFESAGLSAEEGEKMYKDAVSQSGTSYLMDGGIYLGQVDIKTGSVTPSGNVENLTVKNGMYSYKLKQQGSRNDQMNVIVPEVLNPQVENVLVNKPNLLQEAKRVGSQILAPISDLYGRTKNIVSPAQDINQRIQPALEPIKNIRSETLNFLGNAEQTINKKIDTNIIGLKNNQEYDERNLNRGDVYVGNVVKGLSSIPLYMGRSALSPVKTTVETVSGIKSLPSQYRSQPIGTTGYLVGAMVGSELLFRSSPVKEVNPNSYSSFFIREVKPSTERGVPSISLIKTYEKSPEGKVREYLSGAVSNTVSNKNNFASPTLTLTSEIKKGKFKGSPFWSASLEAGTIEKTPAILNLNGVRRPAELNLIKSVSQNGKNKFSASQGYAIDNLLFGSSKGFVKGGKVIEGQGTSAYFGILRKAKQPEQTNIIGMRGGGKKSSSQFLQQMWSDESVKQAEIKSQIKAVQESIKSKNEPVGKPTKSASIITTTKEKEKTATTQKPIFEEALMQNERTKQVSLFSPLELDRQQDINILGFNSNLGERQKDNVKQIDLLGVRETQAQKQRTGQVIEPKQSQQPINKKEPPIKPISPFKRLAERIDKGEDIFTVTGKRFGRDIELLKTSNKQKAEKGLFDFLKGSLGRSGQIYRNGQALNFGELGGLLKSREFRASKKNKNRVVQEAKFSLGSQSERKEIQYFKNKSNKKKKSKKLNWFD